MLKKMPLSEEHRKLNARMVDFSGFDMPVQYTNVLEEHKATRSSAGLFDVSHMGEIFISGKHAFNLVQKTVSRNILPMKNGQIYLAVMCNKTGGIIDDLTIYKFSSTEYLLVVNAGTKDKDLEHILNIKSAERYEVDIRDDTDKIAKLDIQGPNAEKILSMLTNANLSSLRRYHFFNNFVGRTETIISRSGYTGENGFELYFDAKDSVYLWKKLLDTGNSFGIKPIGLGARDTLRIEMGYMLYGNDIDETSTPFESVYSWVVSLDKDFIGVSALKNQKNHGIRKKLVGFIISDRGIARHGYEVYKNGEKIGIVTSGTFAPSLNKNIGFAYIPIEYSLIGATIDIRIRKNLAKAKIVKLPFYKKL